ncbi:7-aminocholesterol resistance protein rta1 [Colletotrichum incanum]|uniref:7-aminocholesterol resistance protein rta1 n=1 Tax=Colletotrichum incanum TaxID=1573173 RepID=A0A166M6F6_COLIC|nr:7-aminocholesterol resistance protein rta1 [Colletotrichum incanum]
MTQPETSIWPYNPSFPLAVVGAVLYGIVFVWIFYLTVIRYRAWYFVIVVFGSTFEVSAYVLRAYSARNQTEITPFVQTTTYTVLAPVLIAAGNYLLIGRLIRAVLPAGHHTIYRVPARRLTHIFVGCDVVAFCIQGAGSGVASGGSWTGMLKKVGTKILIAGLVVQVFCFGVYLCVLVRFHVLAGRMEREGAPRGWKRVLGGVYCSSGLILLRSLYRVVEFAEGMDGYAFRNEWLFWAFEALPMLIAIAVFGVWHPSKYLGRNNTKGELVKGGERFRMEKGSGRDTVIGRGQSV